MKRKVKYAAAFLFLAWAATACEALEECKFCRMVMTDNTTSEVTYGDETEYCGAALIAIEAKSPVTTVDLTTTWECR